MSQPTNLSSWSPAPPVPELQAGRVCVYRFSLAPDQKREEQLRSYLTKEELERAGRFVTQALRTRFVAARGQLREILAAHTGVTPAAVSFTYNAYGKPSLAGDGAVRFNLAHSGELALLAVTLGQEVGVDVEDMRKTVDFPLIARRFFAPGEVTALFALPETDRRQGFYNCWTRKEAYIKARGMGLSIPLDEFEVNLSPAEPARLLYPPENIQLYEIDLGFGYAGALAVDGDVQDICCKSWFLPLL